MTVTPQAKASPSGTSQGRTSQTNPILLARQGNVRAIARLINQAVSPHGVAATVVRHESQLQISLEASTVPDAETFGALVKQGIEKLGIDHLDTLTVYGRSHQDTGAVWQKTYSLGSSFDQGRMEAPTAEAVPQNGMEAIAAQLNQTIGSAQLNFSVEQVEKVLKVTANTDELLSADTFAKSIREVLMALDLTGIDTVEVHKRKTRGNSCYKIKDFTITPDKPAPRQATSRQATGVASQQSGRQTERSTGTTSRMSQTTTSSKPKRSKGTRMLMMAAFILGGLLFIYMIVSRFAKLFTSPFGIVMLLISIPAILKFGGRLGNLWSEIQKDA
jgi:hypothetical protein